MARMSGTSAEAARKTAAETRGMAPTSQPGEVVLLSGGNSQIAKGYATRRCRPTSRPCRAGRAMSGTASTR